MQTSFAVPTRAFAARLEEWLRQEIETARRESENPDALPEDRASHGAYADSLEQASVSEGGFLYTDDPGMMRHALRDMADEARGREDWASLAGAADLLSQLAAS